MTSAVATSEKGKWERLWPVIACGAGLFSDGYLNNVRPLYPPHANARTLLILRARSSGL